MEAEDLGRTCWKEDIEGSQRRSPLQKRQLVQMQK